MYLPPYGALDDNLINAPIDEDKKINLVGSVAICCDPRTYPNREMLATDAKTHISRDRISSEACQEQWGKNWGGSLPVPGNKPTSRSDCLWWSRTWSFSAYEVLGLPKRSAEESVAIFSRIAMYLSFSAVEWIVTVGQKSSCCFSISLRKGQTPTTHSSSLFYGQQVRSGKMITKVSKDILRFYIYS